MIALDTNVLVRFLVRDDPQQAAEASALFAGLTEDNPAWLSREVLVELVWVLERAYRLPRADIASAVDALLAAQEVVVESPDRIGLAVERYRQGGAGFSDHLIALAAHAAGCSATFSFDRQAVARACMTPVPALA
ncbi:PIN domain-containing protein [Paracoccus sp. SY]|uniref:PIN domain-containing protein n=1 Tax=Paracoccus sp. SY TaxID=1330255 RepID=UPI000CD16F1D|nr:type II toxin-antitoxin system VapC family toxin [Paracoccus sp. SY]